MTPKRKFWLVFTHFGDEPKATVIHDWNEVNNIRENAFGMKEYLGYKCIEIDMRKLEK